MANMEAKELRIGNLFIEENSKKIIEVIGLEKNRVVFSGMFLDKWQAEPIPLTEEWLLKFGFEENDNIYKLNNFGKFIFFEHLNSFGFYPSGLLNSLMRMDNLKSVHQLQNLYFALTGKELEIDNG